MTYTDGENSVFLGWKNQCYENDYTTKSNLQIQHDPNQITNGIFHRTIRKNITIHMWIQKTLNSQSNLEKKEWSWRNQSSWLQTMLQTKSHQDSTMLAQKQKCGPREEDRKPRNKPTHLCISYFWQSRQECTTVLRKSLR